MTTNHVTLTSLPFWTCDKRGDNVGSSMTIWQPLVIREKIPTLVASGCWRLIAVDEKKKKGLLKSWQPPVARVKRVFLNHVEKSSL